MSLQFQEYQWVVTYYDNHTPTFERLNTKEEVMDFIQDLKKEKGHLPLNDITVYPPRVDLRMNQIATYGVPEMFLKENDR